mmetsp:Transcript_14807/g.19534  ORF Transcript_14807/g.19534 Transcript_14807/m.19534 type:complete len:410 (-) Transcript_14807:609-1838(-)
MKASSLSNILRINCSKNLTVKFQDGKEFTEWADGDRAISSGHHSLLLKKSELNQRMYYGSLMATEIDSYLLVDLFHPNGLYHFIKFSLQMGSSVALLPLSYPISVISILRSLRISILKTGDGENGNYLRGISEIPTAKFLLDEVTLYFFAPLVGLAMPVILSSILFIPLILLVAFCSQALGVAFILSPFLCSAVFGQSPESLLRVSKMFCQNQPGRLTLLYGDLCACITSSMYPRLFGALKRVGKTIFWLAALYGFVYGMVMPTMRWMSFIWRLFTSLVAYVWQLEVLASNPLSWVSVKLLPSWILLAPVYYTYLTQGNSLIPVLSALSPLYGNLRQARVQPARAGPMFFKHSVSPEAPVLLVIQRRLAQVLNAILLMCYFPVMKYIDIVETSAHAYEQENESDVSCKF